MKYIKFPFMVLFLLLVVVVGIRSQPQVKLGGVHYLRDTGRTVDVKIPPPLHFRNRQIDLPTSKITVTYDDGFHRNPAAKAAFEYAVYLMQVEIASKVEIRGEAVFQPGLLGEDMLFTKWGWIYQYNSIPNNKEDKLTYHWMKKTYEYLYG